MDNFRGIDGAVAGNPKAERQLMDLRKECDRLQQANRTASFISFSKDAVLKMQNEYAERAKQAENDRDAALNRAERAEGEIEALKKQRDRWYGKALERAGWRERAELVESAYVLVGYAEHGATQQAGPGDQILDADEAAEYESSCVTALYAEQRSEGEQGAVDEALTALNELVDAAMSDDDIGRDERVSVYDAVFRRRDCIRRALRQRLLSHRWVERIPTLLRNIEKADDVVLQSWQADRPLTRETQRFIRSALQESHAVIIEIQRAEGGDND